MIKVAIVFGTRPEAIKMAPVVNQFKTNHAWETKVIVTGQHREMLDQVLELFAIVPDYDLNIMTQNQSLAKITTGVLNGLDEIFTHWKPDYILVHGDTTTAFAAALSGFYHRIPIAHVEAGLRTWNLDNPFPEEANRKLIDGLANLFFAPTEMAAANLVKEGIDPEVIHVTGNTVIDALFSVVKSDYDFQDQVIKKLSFDRPVILVTAHRRENWGKPLEQICGALNEVASNHSVDIVFAMHKNPNLQQVVKEQLAFTPNIHLIDAPSYIEFANFLNRCSFLVTDSGGLQEEAAGLSKPVLILRELTERPEGIETGIMKLIGTDQDRIVSEITNLLENPTLYNKMASAPNPYGDGQAAIRIKNIVTSYITRWREDHGNKTR